MLKDFCFLGTFVTRRQRKRSLHSLFPIFIEFSGIKMFIIMKWKQGNKEKEIIKLRMKHGHSFDSESESS